MDSISDLFPPIESARLCLRCIRPIDALATSAMMTPEVSQWVGYWPVPFTVEMAKLRIERARAAAAAGKTLPFAAERLDRVLVGWIVFNRTDEDARRATFGYWFGKAHHGRGYMREVAPLALAAGFRLLDVDVIEASAHPNNVASLAVLRRCGFRHIGQGMVAAPARDRDELCDLFELARPD